MKLFFIILYQIFALVLIFFIPGFLATKIFWPKTAKNQPKMKNKKKKVIDAVETIVLSVILSMAVLLVPMVILGHIGVNVDVWGIFIIVLAIISVETAKLVYKPKKNR